MISACFVQVVVAISIAVATVASASSSASASHNNKPAAAWKQWTCDQLTPNLCDDLEVESGTLEIRSIPVKYWRYKKKKKKKERKKTTKEEEEEKGGRRPQQGEGGGGGATSHYHDDDGDAALLLSGTTIITLHGGPSWPHSYLLPLRQLACRGAEVIFYDQAGCGESTPPLTTKGGGGVEGEEESVSVVVSPSEYPHLLDTSYYSTEELPALIEHWKLDEYHVLGSSWGTILAQLFALDAENTAGLQSLVLSGPLSDAQKYIEAQWDPRDGTLGTLPPFVQERIRSFQERGAYDSAEYDTIDDVLSSFFTLRTSPPPDCFVASADGLNRDVYAGMQGPSEFAISGVLGDFNVTGRLGEIDVPVLLTHGAYDTMRPSIVRDMEVRLRYAERVVLPHSGHVSMIDDAGMMNDVVADFLHRVEGATDGDDGHGTQGGFVPRGKKEDELMVEETFDAMAKWMKVLIAFVAGLVIGRLAGCNGNGGYAQII